MATQMTTTSPKTDFLHHPVVRSALPFINGGLAGMFATACIQPIDMIKVRIQLAGEGSRSGVRPNAFKVAKDIVAAGKFLDLYAGLSAGLLRQAVYTTARMGFSIPFKLLCQVVPNNPVDKFHLWNVVLQD